MENTKKKAGWDYQGCVGPRIAIFFGNPPQNTSVEKESFTQPSSATTAKVNTASNMQKLAVLDCYRDQIMLTAPELIG